MSCVEWGGVCAEWSSALCVRVCSLGTKRVVRAVLAGSDKL